MDKTSLQNNSKGKRTFVIGLSFLLMALIINPFYSSAGDCPRGVFPEMNNGRCSFSKNCFPDPGGDRNDCDSTAPNQGGGPSLPPSLPPSNP